MKKDVQEAFDILVEKYNKKDIELNKTYWVSEWTWNPMTDGYTCCEEVIRYKQNIDGINVYTTGTSYRYYYAWDIYETKEDARKMSSFKDGFGYDWCPVEFVISKEKIEKILK